MPVDVRVQELTKKLSDPNKDLAQPYTLNLEPEP